MPEEETNNAVKCEICSSDLEEDAHISSTHQYEIVCSSCESDLVSCDGCSELFQSDDAPYSTCCGEPVCPTCNNGGDFASCECCGDLINLTNGDYMYDDNYDQYCCTDNAGDTQLDWSCSRCDATMYFSDLGTDHAADELCYDCYHNPEASISNEVGTWVDASAVKGDYTNINSVGSNLISWFYGYNADDYKNSSLMVKKGGLQLNDFGYWKSSIKVASPVYKDFAYIIKEMLQRDLFFTRHKKYGLYHPLRHLFHSCIKYYDRNTGEYFHGGNNPSIDFEAVVVDINRYDISGYMLDKIVSMLRSNKTDEGANLRRAITNNLNRSLSERFNHYSKQRMDDMLAERRYNEYLTNAVDVEYPINIGYDPSDLSDIAKFNHNVSSCQDRNNKLSYSFGYADLLVNPHLFALIRDNDGTIIGRSLIRLFKHDWDDDTEPVSVAPSRLYLNANTQAKKEFYVQLFKEVDAWASDVLPSHQLLAYSDSRHDSSVASYLRDSADIKVIQDREDNKRLRTKSWYAFWYGKPTDSTADYGYYQDESQNTRVYGIRSAGEGDYALQETLPAFGYKIIEANNEN